MNDAAKRLLDQILRITTGSVLRTTETCLFDRPLPLPERLEQVTLEGGGSGLLRFELNDPAHQTAIELIGAQRCRLRGLRIDCLVGNEIPYFAAVAMRAAHEGMPVAGCVVDGCEIVLDAPFAGSIDRPAPAYGIYFATSLIAGAVPRVQGGTIARNTVICRRGKLRAIQLTGCEQVTVHGNRVVDVGQPVGDRKGISLIGSSHCAVINNQVFARDSSVHWTGVRVNGVAAEAEWLNAESNFIGRNRLDVDDVGLLLDRGARKTMVVDNISSARVAVEVRDGADPLERHEESVETYKPVP